MIMGDFNLIPNEIAKVARKNNLKLCPSPTDGTREGRNGSRSTLDYVMHDFEMEVTSPIVIPQLSTSDHELMLVKTVRKVNRPDNTDTRRKVIRKGITHNDMMNVLRDSNWPQT